MAKGKKEEDVPLACIAEERKEAKGFSCLPTPPFSLPPLPFSTPATQATYGIWPWKKIAFGEGNVVKAGSDCSQKIICGEERDGQSMNIYIHI